MKAREPKAWVPRAEKWPWVSVFCDFVSSPVARKLKKIGQQKNPEEDHLVQDLEVVQNLSPKSGLTFSSQVVFLNILESIEPEVVNAGHDYCQPDSAATLLTSLNELGERQLVKVVKWAKGLPGRTLSVAAQVGEQRRSDAADSIVIIVHLLM